MRPNFLERQKKLKKVLEEKEIDAIITMSSEDIFYYTGYQGLREDRVFMLLPMDGRPKLFVSVLENEAHLRYPEIIYMKRFEDLIGHLKPYKTIGFDETNIPVLLYQEITKLTSKLIPISGILLEKRMVKDEYEITQIKNSVKITAKIFEKISEKLYGKTEKDVANEIEIEYKKFGKESAFEPIVCSGKNTQFIHHKASEKIIKPNELILIDTSCSFNGYCSDVTRMFFRHLGVREKKVYEDVKQIHDEILSFIKAGITYKKVEELHNNLFKKKGYTPIHNFGHGVGLSIHEPIGEIIKENMVITIEPGIYIKNFAGFRIEDTVIIKKNRAEILSKPIPIL
ncbi:MAG: Xaa-Pro peptidase family protein [Candidatus Aenigmatarchaeota archaeon]